MPDRPDSWHRARPALYGAGFVTAFGAHAVAANLAGFATGHHDALWQLGLMLGVYDAAEVVLKPVFGAIIDRRGAKPVMVAGLIAFAVTSGTFALAGSGRWLLVARLAQGSAAAAFSPAAGAAIAALGGRKRGGRLFGGYGGAKGVGYLLGPLLGGAIVEVSGYRLLFGVVGAIALVAALAVVVRVPRAAPSPPRARAGLGSLVAQLHDPEFIQPVLLLGAGSAALSAGVGFLPLIGVEHGLRPFATGALVSLLAATAALVQPWSGRRHDAGALRPSVGSFGLLAAATGFAVAALAPGVAGLVTAALAIGAGVAVVTPIGFARLAAGTASERLGRTMGAAEVGRELGDAGGPALVGALGVLGLGAGMAALAAALVASAVGTSPVWRSRGAPDVAP